MREKLLYWVGWYKNTAYWKKLILTYLLLGAAPLIILCGIFMARLSSQAMRQTDTLVRTALTQTADALDQRLNQIGMAAGTLSIDGSLRKLLERKSQTLAEQLKDYKLIEETLTAHMQNSGAYRIRLYVPDGRLYSHQNVYTFSLPSLLADPGPNAPLDYTGKLTFSAPYNHLYIYNNPQRIISASRMMISMADLHTPIGLIMVDILESDGSRILERLDLSGEGYAYILDPQGGTVASRGGYLDSSSSSVLSWSGKITAANWTLHYLLPRDVAESSGRKFLFQAVLTAMAVIIPSVALVLLAYMLQARRITRLARHVETMDLDNMEPLPSSSGMDEIGMLESRFNEMALQQRKYHEERLEQIQRIQQLEMRLLHARIQPHFLYNTLDLARWAATRGDFQQVIDIVVDLTRYYRLSLRKGMTTATLSQEIEHVRRYLNIQNRRFEKQIDLTIRVPDGLLDTPVPHFLLQPLVENSLVHGLLRKRTDEARIRIEARLDGEYLVITVTDNGAGMSAERRDSILKQPDADSESGYGVMNLDERLRLLDERNKMKFYSEEGEYTCVEIWMVRN
jgi:two-component system sensor histidine kinase YesM